MCVCVCGGGAGREGEGGSGFNGSRCFNGFRLISFKFTVMTDITILYTFNLTSIILTVIQGHMAQNTQQFCTHCLTMFSFDPVKICYCVGMCWFD